jgi:large subunit ribosomal protein L9
MKVILNQDVKYLGEEGDVKIVANGYARNYLLPRKLAVQYNPYTVKFFEGKKAEIEERKLAKRADAQSLKEKLEAFVVEVSMSSGPTGKLYGAVTNQTIADELTRHGFDIERKRIEVPGLAIKHTGKYAAAVHLYESASATVQIVVTSREEIEAKQREAQKAAKSVKKTPPPAAPDNSGIPDETGGAPEESPLPESEAAESSSGDSSDV